MLTNDQIKTFDLLLNKDSGNEESRQLERECVKRIMYLDKIIHKSMIGEKLNEFEKEYVKQNLF